MYNNKTALGGRPEADVIVMFKKLVLQQWHGPSDAELERQSLIEYPFRNSWIFQNIYQILQLSGHSTGGTSIMEKEEQIWGEMQKHLDALGLKIKKE